MRAAATEKLRGCPKFELLARPAAPQSQRDEVEFAVECAGGGSGGTLRAQPTALKTPLRFKLDRSRPARPQAEALGPRDHVEFVHPRRRRAQTDAPPAAGDRRSRQLKTAVLASTQQCSRRGAPPRLKAHCKAVDRPVRTRDD